MDGFQPLLHDLICTYSAPAQLWTQPDGSVVPHGVQGLSVGDERILAGIALASPTHTVEHIRTVRAGASRQVLHYVLRRPGLPVDPVLTLVRTRDVTPLGLEETFEIRFAGADVAVPRAAESANGGTSVSAGPDPAERVALALTLVPDGTPMEAMKQGLSPGLTLVLGGGEWSWRAGARAVLSHDFDPGDRYGAVAGRVSPDAPFAGVSGSQQSAEPGESASASPDRAELVLDREFAVAPGSVARARWAVRAEVYDAVVGPAPRAELARRGAGAIARTAGDIRELLRRALEDLDALTMTRAADPGHPFLAAGAPWFFTMFGRDSLISARFVLPVDVELAGTTLSALAAMQGTKANAETGEQPGKILHEVRREELRLAVDSAGEIALPPVYYGTIDATPLWISLLHDYWRAGGSAVRVRNLVPHLRAALAWMRDYGALNDDGFLRYFDPSGRGLANQGWKDSGDSVRWHDGTLAEGPIALAEVQGYAYRAALDGAAVLEAHGAGSTGEWRAWAAAMEARFRERFWVSDDDGAYPAIALDAQGNAVDSVASNMGHLLGTGILNEGEARLVVERLCGPTMFSGFGIRTVSTTNGGYWPLRYHAGSVWPHDTAYAIDGMLREGFAAEAETVARGLLHAARAFDFRLPELFGGHAAEEVGEPVPYPASCRPQGWAAGAAIVIARALGVAFDVH